MMLELTQPVEQWPYTVEKVDGFYLFKNVEANRMTYVQRSTDGFVIDNGKARRKHSLEFADFFVTPITMQEIMKADWNVYKVNPDTFELKVYSVRKKKSVEPLVLLTRCYLGKSYIMVKEDFHRYFRENGKREWEY